MEIWLWWWTPKDLFELRPGNFDIIQLDTLAETNSKFTPENWSIGGWETIPSSWEGPFSGAMLALGRVISRWDSCPKCCFGRMQQSAIL